VTNHTNVEQLTAERETTAPAFDSDASRRRLPDFHVGLDRFSGMYVIAVMVIVFCLWEPSTFATVTNLRVTAASQAITGILTIGLIVSLVSGVFDLSIASNMSLSISVLGSLQASQHLNAALAVVLILLLGGLIGVANAIVVTVLHVEPVIGTLGMSSVLTAISFWVAGGRTVLDGISSSFTHLGTGSLIGVPLPIFYLAGVALVFWYVLEQTPFGRYLYAIGSNAEASRLAGLKVINLQWWALIISGIVASLAGVVLTMSLGAASFGAGNSYLLPAFAAAFLGSTQMRPGRFNVLGTLVAVYLLAIGVRGLQLRFPSASWIADLFQGTALILAVALARRAGRRSVAM
jgi:ribose transport system permease protein